jgi:MFS family permease
VARRWVVSTFPRVTPDVARGTTVLTNVPPRLDALRWSSWHTRVVIALGITWALDGLEASLIANLGPTLRNPRTLGMSAFEVGIANSIYLFGQVVGAIVFGHLTDRWGRKRLFFVTLTLYLSATALSGLVASIPFFFICRMFAGSGIGGEYSAVNSAIDELIPSRLRGQIDLAINGSYWIGAALAGGLTLVVLNPSLVPITIGWRIAFCLGAFLGLGILFLRRHVPESPRWLLMHGYVRDADRTTREIESQVGGEHPRRVPEIKVRVTGTVGLSHLLHTLLRRYPRRSILGLVLMVSQAFFYNAIFFTYALILERFYGVAADRVGLYVVPFAVCNFMGPLFLGRLFDHWGRRVMIPATFAMAGLLLVLTGGLFLAGRLNAVTQTAAWCAVFFFASAAASSGYLTVSELFPVELRGLVIAVFYAVATAGGAVAPAVFGLLIDVGSRARLFEGYAFASTLMFIAAAVARVNGVDSERRSLEEITA